MLSPRFRIPVNTLLRGGEPTMTVDEFRVMQATLQLAGLLDAEASGPINAAAVSDATLDRVAEDFGPAGLWQLMQMVMSLDANEFAHFFDVARDGLSLQDLLPPAPELEFDNAALPQSPDLDNFNWNLVQPSLSRKLYRAGRHHGSLVYGLGGPRILVSHPFRGAEGESYDMYNNTVDVVTSLFMRGYYGSFHFLDLLPGLNHEVHGVEAWLLWFSIIAGHSDLVIYVKQHEGEFGPSQRGEIAFTPDRVHKKIVEIPHDELTWARENPEIEGLPVMYIGDGGMMTQDEWYTMEAQHAAPFVAAYERGGVPNDRLFRMDESGEVTEYSLDQRVYEYP